MPVHSYLFTVGNQPRWIGIDGHLYETLDDSYVLEIAHWPGGKRRFLLRCDFHGNWIRWRA